MGELVELQTVIKQPRREAVPDALTISSFEDAKRAFLLDCKVKNLSRRTLVWYEKKLVDFEKFLSVNYAGLALSSVVPEIIKSFICYLQQKGNEQYPGKLLSTHTVAGIVRVLRVFFNFLSTEGYLQSNPCEKIRVPKIQKKQVKALSENEIQKLLSIPDVKTFTGLRNYLIMLILLDTGMRLSELLYLKINDVDWERYTFKVLGKGNKEREVPFGKNVARLLPKYLKWRGKISGHDIIFINQSGEPLKARRLEFILQLYGKKAGIEKLHPHRFRHTTALNWIKAGGDALSLQRLLGHTSLEMVKNYVFLVSSDVAEKHHQFGLVDRLNLNLKDR